MLSLALWIVYQTGWSNISFTLASKILSPSEQVWQMLTATALVVSYFAGPLLNFGDFSRYGKSMQEIRRGNRWGLPFNFLLFSLVTVVIVSGSQSLFGEMITDYRDRYPRRQWRGYRSRSTDHDYRHYRD